jgi:hypothetical protein
MPIPPGTSRLKNFLPQDLHNAHNYPNFVNRTKRNTTMTRTNESIESFNRVESHNGYTNIPTFILMGRIETDCDLHFYWITVAGEILSDIEEDEILTAHQAAVKELSEELQGYLEQDIDNKLGANMLYDLLTWAKAYIDFAQVAEMLIERAKEEQNLPD